MIGRYRKKPVEIEAILFDGSVESIHQAQRWAIDYWVGKTIPAFSITLVLESDNSSLEIPTIEGRIKAMRGDYIIKGVKGEIYPCKPDIFDQTYNPV